MINSQYNSAQPGSVPVKVAAHQRRKMFDGFLRCMPVNNTDSILDIGVTSDQTYSHSNYFEAWYSFKGCITALGIDDATFIETIHPGVKFVRGDGRCLPFRDNSFDYVHSSAVLEHVGSRERQTGFLREAWRVARKGIYVTTPNRWFPVEFHTVLPLVHWLPVSCFRSILRALGHTALAQEENLNLLSRRALMEAARSIGIEHFEIQTVSLLGWPTNLLFSATKPFRAQNSAAHASE